VPGEAFDIAFAGRRAVAVRVTESADLASAIRSVGLNPPIPTLVLVGGAGGLAARERDRLRPLFGQALVPVLAAVEGAVVDGGTDSGVMRLMGEAVAQAGHVLPLIGVVALGTVTVPGTSAAAGTAKLEPHHSHFVLVPGTDWGDESEWLAELATLVAGPRASATLLVNGGETAWRDVEASIAARRPVIVLEGSGRAADDIAAALRGTRADDRGYRLAASGLVRAISLDVGVGELAEAVKALLGG